MLIEAYTLLAMDRLINPEYPDVNSLKVRPNTTRESAANFIDTLQNIYKKIFFIQDLARNNLENLPKNSNPNQKFNQLRNTDLAVSLSWIAFKNNSQLLTLVNTTAFIIRGIALSASILVTSLWSASSLLSINFLVSLLVIHGGFLALLFGLDKFTSFRLFPHEKDSVYMVAVLEISFMALVTPFSLVFATPVKACAIIATVKLVEQLALRVTAWFTEYLTKKITTLTQGSSKRHHGLAKSINHIVYMDFHTLFQTPNYDLDDQTVANLDKEHKAGLLSQA